MKITIAFSGLKDIRRNIAEDIDKCQQERVCKDFKLRYNINDLSVETNFSQVIN